MAAYGLYTHIASNKFRSMMMLGGLFLLIYVLVYAGALLAEVFLHSDRSVEFYLGAASRDLIAAFPYATAIAAAWIVIAYFFHQNMIDAVTGGEGPGVAVRHARPGQRQAQPPDAGEHALAAPHLPRSGRLAHGP